MGTKNLICSLKNGERFRFVGEDEIYVVHTAAASKDSAVIVHLEDQSKWLWAGPALSTIRPDEPVEVVQS